VTLALTLWLSARLAFNMDEFLVYHAIGCGMQACTDLWNRGREACRAFDVAPFSWLTSNPIYLPLRSFPYVGSLQGLFYLPLYLLWPSPYSARFFGVFLIGAQGVLISKTFGHPALVTVPLLLLFMPYTVQHLMDTGQMSVYTTAVFLLVFLNKRWLAALVAGRAWSWVLATTIGVVNICILLLRLNNVAYIPALALLQLGCMSAFGLQTAWRLRKGTLSVQVIWIVGIFLFGAFALFTAVDRGNAPLHRAIFDTMAKSVSVHAPLPIVAFRHFVKDLSIYFLSPLLSAHVAHRIELKPQIEGIGLIALVVLFFGYAWSIARGTRYRLLSFVCVVAFALGILSISGVSRSWAMHHLIPVFPILMVGIFSLIPPNHIRRGHVLMLLCFIAINISLYRQVIQLKPAGSAFDPRLKAYNDEINEKFSSSHLMIVSAWGVYYTKLLYGPRDQCLMWADDGDTRSIEAAKRAKEAVKKPTLFISYGKKPPGYWRAFADNLEEVQTTTKIGEWRLWREVPPTP
jgi:hypothetical protein